MTTSAHALEVTAGWGRTVVRFDDVRSLPVRCGVLVLRRRGGAVYHLPVAALPDGAVAQMRGAFAALDA